MPTLNPKQAGGIEPIEATPYAVAAAKPGSYADLNLDPEHDDDADSQDSDAEDEDEPMVASTSTAPPRKLAPGEGRIERDETGKIVRVVVGGANGTEIVQDVFQRPARAEGEESSDSEGESDEEEEEKPWGEAMAEWSGEGSDDEVLDEEVITGPRRTGQGIPIGAKRRKVAAKTDVVRRAFSLSPRCVLP